ncbi:MAG: MFS transporter [Dehalococcoidia bacterium]|nr:MFS transporter [Dehalococcoidia bacterium]
MKKLHYGWVMVFSAMGILAVNSQPFYSFGLFLKAITEEQRWERGALALSLSIMMLVANPLSVLAGRMSDKYGPRFLVTISGISSGTGFLLLSQVTALWQVYLIFGGLVAIGSATCGVPVTSTIPRWFTKRRGMALGFIYAGMTIGGIIGPLLTGWIIRQFNWRWAMGAFGAMSLLVIVPLAQTLKRTPQDAGLTPYGEEPRKQITTMETVTGFTLKQAVKTARFWLFAGILTCQFFIGQTIITHIAPHITDLGLSEAIAAGVLSIYALTSMAGTFLSGIITERIGTRRTLLASFSLLLLMLVWLLFIQEVWMFYVLVIFYGLAFGILIPLQTAAPGEFFGLKSLGTISSTMWLLGAVGGATGPPLAGAIFDARGGYLYAFIISIGIAIIAIVLSSLLPRVNRRKGIAI